MKQTEIGLIPDDWEVKEFKQEATLINGRAYAQFELLKQGKYKVLRVGNFGTNDNWYYSNLELPEKQYCTKGDLLYCWSCTYGAYIWNEPNTIYHYHIWKIISKGADKEYLKYILNNDTENQMKSSNGSTMAHITKGFLENRLFAFPPLAEQQRIAKALSDVDALISTTEKLIQKKKNIKQGTMQNLLTGKKRLPGFGPRTKFPTYKQTELGPIPEDWEVKTLGELGSFKNGISKPSEDFGFGSPFVNLMDIFGITKISETNHLGLINSNIIEQNTYSLKEGDVLFVRSSVKPEGVGLTTIIKKDLDKTVYSGFILRFREIGNELTTDFKEYVFYNKGFRDSLISSSTVSANTNINQPALKKLIIVYPSSKEEQTAIANVLSSMDKEIETLNTKLEKYRNLKTAMMQQLLTGKIRLV